MPQQDIRAGAGTLKNGAQIVREARQSFDRKGDNLHGEIQGMASGWTGQGGQAFQGLANSWAQRQKRITKLLDDLANSLDETDRDNVQNDAAVSDGFVAMAKGLEA